MVYDSDCVNNVNLHNDVASQIILEIFALLKRVTIMTPASSEIVVLLHVDDTFIKNNFSLII